MTVVETVRFLKDAGGLMPESDRAELIEFIDANPEAGNVIQRPVASESCVGLCRAAANEGGHA